MAVQDKERYTKELIEFNHRQQQQQQQPSSQFEFDSSPSPTSSSSFTSPVTGSAKKTAASATDFSLDGDGHPQNTRKACAHALSTTRVLQQQKAYRDDQSSSLLYSPKATAASTTAVVPLRPVVSDLRMTSPISIYAAPVQAFDEDPLMRKEEEEEEMSANVVSANTSPMQYPSVPINNSNDINHYSMMALPTWNCAGFHTTSYPPRCSSTGSNQNHVGSQYHYNPVFGETTSATKTDVNPASSVCRSGSTTNMMYCAQSGNVWPNHSSQQPFDLCINDYDVSSNILPPNPSGSWINLNEL